MIMSNQPWRLYANTPTKLIHDERGDFVVLDVL